jgi:predicted NAD/FAD-dependent oxidoreductase
MLGFERPLPLAFDAARVYGEDISWIAVNSSKPHRPGDFSLLVHSTNEWATLHIDDDKDKVIGYLSKLTSALLHYDVSEAKHVALHRWRYANIEKQYGKTHYIDVSCQLAACGDWCIEGRVEAAFISGFETASSLIKLLDHRAE